MSSGILFVDDDVSLLNSLERNLSFDYQVRFVDSGMAGLEALKADRTTAVVVTDMNMPKMNGVQFIEQARRLVPEAIFLMLTGNQDVDTAIRAVNDGSVFRFLNKPCSVTEIRAAIDAATKQYQLIHSEKELLQKTFVGAVNLLTDVLEALRPELIQQSQRVDAIMKTCEAEWQAEGSWEYRLAGRLGLVGFGLLPVPEQDLFQRLEPAHPESVQLFEKIATMTSRLIERIPRLNRISQIIQGQITADGSALIGSPNFHSVEVGSTLLRVGIHWATMVAHGVPPNLALRRLRSALPCLPEEIDRALLRFSAAKVVREPVRVTLPQLRPGMVLLEDARGTNGAVLLCRGYTLTEAIIERLRLHYRHESHAHFVIEATDDAVEPLAEVLV